MLLTVNVNMPCCGDSAIGLKVINELLLVGGIDDEVLAKVELLIAVVAAVVWLSLRLLLLLLLLWWWWCGCA